MKASQGLEPGALKYTVQPTTSCATGTCFLAAAAAAAAAAAKDGDDDDNDDDYCTGLITSHHQPRKPSLIARQPLWLS